jgi:hypothetical protein
VDSQARQPGAWRAGRSYARARAISIPWLGKRSPAYTTGSVRKQRRQAVKLIEACVVVSACGRAGRVHVRDGSAGCCGVARLGRGARRRARQAAGRDLGALFALCKPASPTQMTPEQVDRYLTSQIALPAPPPGQAFDNLYFVGGAWVSAWALTTSRGDPPHRRARQPDRGVDADRGRPAQARPRPGAGSR